LTGLTVLRFRQRAAEPELMDDPQEEGAELAEAYRRLRTLNKLFGASHPVLFGVRKLWQDAGRPMRFSILDIGAGSGDINRALLKWADRNGVRLHIVLADRSETACAEAQRCFRGEPRVEVVQADVRSLPAASCDVVTATQFAHHFSDMELPAIISRMLNASRWGVVLNDIHRHWLPWAAVWLTTRISRNRMIRHDGPLSVAKGFRAEDWRRLSAKLPGYPLQYRWKALFRYVVVIQKPDDRNGANECAARRRQKAGKGRHVR